MLLIKEKVERLFFLLSIYLFYIFNFSKRLFSLLKFPWLFQLMTEDRRLTTNQNVSFPF